jgi:arabinan endo-1,5-alpha-L-arabinosidase
MTSQAFGQSYTNPVKRKNLPDPSVIRANDGYFYIYSTDNGEQSVPIYRSTDLVHWRLAGGAFVDATRPQWVSGAGIWAPDINYIEGKYVLYYSLSTWGGEWDCGIGVATSDKPNGLFEDKGKLFTSSEIGVKNSIDPCFFQDDDGQNYLFWGSFRGIYGMKLSKDGLTAYPETKFQVAPGQDGNVNNTEGTMIVKRGKYYYLIGSSGSCCDGINSTYHVVVARSTSIQGPYVNRQGYSIMNHPFETILTGSDTVIGPGHNSEWLVDDNGHWWMLYHGFDASNPDEGRLLYLDQILWDNSDWPYIQNGQPSKEAVAPYYKPLTKIYDAKLSANGQLQIIGCDNSYTALTQQSDDISLSVFNKDGQLIWQDKSKGSIDVWLGNYPNDIYILKAKDKKAVVTKKISKR